MGLHPRDGVQQPQTHLTVLGGAGHAPGFIFSPGKDDDGVKNLDVGNMGTVLEEALCMHGQRKGKFREDGQNTHLCDIRVGVRHGVGTANQHVGRLRILRGKGGYAVCQQGRQGAIEHATGDIVILKEGKVAGKNLEKHLNEVHEHRRVGHGAMTRIE